MRAGAVKEENPDHLPEQLFRLKHEQLKPGDVIASTVPESIVSKVIRWQTNGEFSHVALCFMRTVVLEALGEHGVILSVPNRIFVEKKDNIAVFRPKSDFINIPNFENNLAEKCMDAWLSGYALAKLGYFVFPQVTFRASNKSFFCSELVSSAYLNCELTLCESSSTGEALKPEHISPQKICESKHLDRLDNEDIFEEVSKEQFNLLYRKGGFAISDSPQKSSNLSLDLEMHSGLQGFVRNTARDKSSWEFQTKYMQLHNTMFEAKIKQHIDPAGRWKDLEDAFSHGLAEKKIALSEQITVMHLEGLETLRILIKQHWDIEKMTHPYEENANAYLLAVQRLIGLMYINEMLGKEDAEYLRRLQDYSARGQSIDDLRNAFQRGCRFF